MNSGIRSIAQLVDSLGDTALAQRAFIREWRRTRSEVGPRFSTMQGDTPGLRLSSSYAVAKIVTVIPQHVYG